MKQHSTRSRLNRQQGKRFEREILIALQKYPDSFALPQPSMGVRFRGIPVPPLIDLLFIHPGCCLSLECKSTKGKYFYLGNKHVKKQIRALRDFSKRGPFYRGILLVHFVKKRKVVIIDRFKDVKRVSQDDKGYSREKGIWNISDWITNHVRKQKKKMLP